MKISNKNFYNDGVHYYILLSFLFAGCAGYLENRIYKHNNNSNIVLYSIHFYPAKSPSQH